MAIPIIFLAKAMTTRLLISSAIAALFVAIFIASPHFIVPNIHQIKNETLFLERENQENSTVMMPISGGAVGPESFAFDGGGGGPYTGVSDGRIVRWRANESRWVDFAVTSPERDGCEGSHDHSQTEPICGRPLGLGFNEKTGDLYIADAYLGLQVVGPNGGLSSPLSTEVNGVAFGFTNSLDIDPDSGTVYFTDSSTRFTRRNHISVIITGDNTGRLMKFDVKTRKTSLLLNNLKFPNGVAVSKDGDFLVFVETTTCRLFKLWLKTPKVGNVEVIYQFPGFPDNVKRNENGEFWVGINSRRGKFLEWIISNPWIGNTLVRVLDVTKIYSCLVRFIGKTGLGIKLDGIGNVVEVLDSNKGKRWKQVSEVNQRNENLWIGSVTMSYVVKDKIPTTSSNS
ncbi:hypothetical protein ACS0TY_024833 [Phlomoides rotata]